MRKLKKVLALVLVFMLLVTSTSVMTMSVSAAEDTTIYFEVPDDWQNFKNIYCHIWVYNGDSLASWQSKKEKCVDEGNGIWSYDLSKVGGLEEGQYYGVIFSLDIGTQTYDTIMTTDCIGDTLYCNDTIYEHPMDSSKTCRPAFWKNQSEKDLGPVMQITSIGNIIGTCLPPDFTKEDMFALYLESGLDNARTYSGKSDQQIIDDIIYSLDISRETAAQIIDESCFDVEWVNEFPFVSISCEDISLMENVDGYFSTYYDWDEEITWFKYNVGDRIRYTVELKDGSTISGIGDEIYYDSTWFDISYETNQSYENPWGVGSHEVQVSLGDLTTIFDAVVEESPFVGLSCKDITLTESIDGYYDEDYDWDTDMYTPSYFVYNIEDYLEIDITLSDGSVMTVSGSEFEYMGRRFYVEYSTDQSYENQWGIGTHTATVEFAGMATTVKVNIEKFPYKSIEVISVDSVDASDLDTYTSFHSGKPHYNTPSFKYKVTHMDGSYFIAGFTEHSFNNDPSLSVTDDQYENPWYPGGENTLTVSYGSLSTTVSVDVYIDEYEYTEQNGGIYITDYLGFEENVTIPSEINGLPVVGIVGLDSGQRVIKTLTIPDSVVSVGEKVFKNYFTALETLNIGSGVSYIDPDMVDKCGSLKNITVSANNKNYAAIDGVLYNKAKNTLVVYPVGKGTEYKVPASVTNLDVLLKAAYRELNVVCDDASRSYVTEDGVTYTADKTTIIRCDSGKSGVYTMPSTVTKIGEYAFSGCDSLTEVKFSEKVTDVVYGAFEYCYSLEKVTLPKSVKSIGGNAFRGCEMLEEINLSDDIEIIEHGAFSSCYALNIQALPASLKTIDSYAFYEVYTDEITIPDGIESIDAYAIPNAKRVNISSLDVLNNAEISGSIFSDAELYVDGKKVTKLIIPDGWTSVQSRLFSQCSSITEVVIPDSVKELGENAFSMCENLKTVTLGKGLTDIPKNAFYGCESIETITIPKNIEVIADGAFAGCSSLSDVVIENKNAVASATAFVDTAIAELSVTDDKGIHTIKNGKYSGVIITDSVTDLVYGSYSRWDYEDIKDIDLPDNLLKIGGDSFRGTEWYENQNDGVVYLEHVLLNYKGYMPGNTSVEIKEGTTSIADYAFNDCRGLVSVTLPQGLKRIGTLAFHGCDNLKSIHIPASVSEIGNFAFANCKSLAEITVDPENEYFRVIDGVLYNKQATELIWCPKLDSDSFTIPINVAKVRSFAFGESGVKHILVPGNRIQFEDYALGYSYSSSLRGEVIIYVDYTCLETIKCHEGSTAEYFTNNGVAKLSRENTGGDVNNDGRFSISDATSIQKNLAGLIEFDNNSAACADYNFDGTVNVRDVTSIQLRLAGMA